MKTKRLFRVVGKPGCQYLFAVVDEGHRIIWWRLVWAVIRQYLHF